MGTLIQDLRYASRMLLKRPGFTAVAVLTLAVGIGANTAIFSYVNSLFLQPLPLKDPERLVRLYGVGADDRSFDTFSYPNFADLRERTQTVADFAAHQYTSVSLNTGGGAEESQGELVTGNYFAMLGENAGAGRTLSPEDDQAPGAHPVIVISHGLWARRFGSDPGVIGKTLHINGHPFTVVGVMRKEFKGTFGAFATEFWVPMMMHEQVRPTGLKLDRRGWDWLFATGRLRPGVAHEQARAEIERVTAQLREEYPNENRTLGFQIVRAGMLPEEYRQGTSGVFLFFMIVAALVLLAACANVASVLLSRVVARQHEVAIRQSLGATRARLLRQWLTESLLLALLGAAAGLGVAAWVGDAMLALVPPDFTNFSPALNLDLRVLAFTTGVALLTGLLCGLFPALRASKTDVISTLKEGGAAVGGRSRSRVQQAFVVVQVAVSLVLLVAAGLLLRSLRESQVFSPGFETDNLLLVKLDLNRNQYGEERGQAFYSELTERLKMLPGVRGATLAMTTPLAPERETRGLRIPGHEPPPGRSTFSIDTNIVGPDYFATIGIPLQRGRGFEQRDAQAGAPRVVVINETMARRFWPDGDAVGQSVQFGTKQGATAEIVGIVADINYYSVGEEPRPFIYSMHAQTFWPVMTMHLRTGVDPDTLKGVVRKEIEALDPNVAVTNLVSFAELRQVSLAPGRAMAIVSGAFGAVALMLAVVGLYGVMSYAVSQRTREIGIRMALGARARDILRLIVSQGMALTLAGIAVGLAASFAATRFLASMLFGVSATDPLTFVAVAALLSAVAMLACYLPARRASKVDPMEALRYE